LTAPYARDRRIEAFPISAVLPAAARTAVERVERPPPFLPRPTTQQVSALAAIRNLPFNIVAGPLTPQWARGQAPSRTHGPFLNQRDEPVWIDILRPLKLVSLLWSGHSQPQLNAIARQLNQRPRKTLGFHTPAEMFSERVALTG
jgi:hypothetical protein